MKRMFAMGIYLTYLVLCVGVLAAGAVISSTRVPNFKPLQITPGNNAAKRYYVPVADNRIVSIDNIGLCSGFLIGPDLVATAGHCVQYPEMPILVSFIDGNPEVAEIIAAEFSTITDYALLRVKTDNRGSFPFSLNSPESEAAIYRVGYESSSFSEQRQYKGVFTGLSYSTSGLYYTAALPSMFGASGSAVFNDSGAVIGIVSRVRTAPEQEVLPLTYITPITFLIQKLPLTGGEIE